MSMHPRPKRLNPDSRAACPVAIGVKAVTLFSPFLGLSTTTYPDFSSWLTPVALYRQIVWDSHPNHASDGFDQRCAIEWVDRHGGAP